MRDSVCMSFYENSSVLEELEEEIRDNDFTASYFRHQLKSSSQLISFEDDSSSYYKLDTECSHEYLLFKLFCFFDMSVREIYELVCELSRKYNKNDLEFLHFSDFEKLANLKKWKVRKKNFLRDSPPMVRKRELRESVFDSNLDNLVEEYDDTLDVIKCLNQDMKDICNDLDVAPEKRLELIGKYSKISIRLNEKRFGLLSKIREVEL